MSNTTKKTKIVGTETYINNRTGELEDFQVLRMEDTDFDFDKIWLAHILSAVDTFSNQKMKLLSYLLKKRERSNNAIITTLKKLEADTGISYKTIVETLKILEVNKIIKRQTGVIFVNPDVVFRGSHANRMRVLLDYRRVDELEPSKDSEDVGNVISIQKAS